MEAGPSCWSLPRLDSRTCRRPDRLRLPAFRPGLLRVLARGRHSPSDEPRFLSAGERARPVRQQSTRSQPSPPVAVRSEDLAKGHLPTRHEGSAGAGIPRPLASGCRRGIRHAYCTDKMRSVATRRCSMSLESNDPGHPNQSAVPIGANRWFPVRSLEDWAAICAALCDFHDAIVREAVWLGPEWVGSDGGLRAPFRGSGLLVAVQRQPIRGSAPQSALLLFRSPSEFGIRSHKDSAPRLNVEKGVALEFGPLEVRASELWFRFPRPPQLGTGPFGLEDSLCLFLEGVRE